MKSKGFTQRITVLMSPEMMQGLIQLADRKMTDPSKIIRNLISKAISGKQVKQ